MVKHLVSFTLKDGMDKDAEVARIRGLLEPLKDQIPGVLELEVRRCFVGVDFALYSVFANKEDLNTYANHPLHLAALAQFKGNLAGRVAADYEV